MLTVVATERARAGREGELRQALVDLVEPIGREGGYVDDDLHQSVEDPAEFAFSESWESEEPV